MRPEPYSPCPFVSVVSSCYLMYLISSSDCYPPPLLPFVSYLLVVFSHRTDSGHASCWFCIYSTTISTAAVGTWHVLSEYFFFFFFTPLWLLARVNVYFIYPPPPMTLKASGWPILLSSFWLQLYSNLCKFLKFFFSRKRSPHHHLSNYLLTGLCIISSPLQIFFFV